MALLVIQLARVVLVIINFDILIGNLAWDAAEGLIVPIHEMLNVRHQSWLFYVLLITWTWLGYSTDPHPGAGVNGIVFP